MTPSAGASTCCLVATVALLAAPDALADEPRSHLREAIQRDLPRYDPAAYEKARVRKAARDAAMQKALAAVPAEKANPPAKPGDGGTPGTPPGTAAGHGEAAFELPKVTVRPTYEAPKHLPRQDAPKPLRDLQPEPFESDAGRHDRLMKKHLSPLERALSRIPLLGAGIAGKAHEAESREQKAAQMNALADGIELQEFLGRDPAEIRKLRAEYEKLYYSGPKN